LRAALTGVVSGVDENGGKLSTALRTIVRDYQRWTVRERDGRAVPGARGHAYLVFESTDAVRRFWIFPWNWRELNDEQLWRLGEVSSPSATEAVSGVQSLRSVFIASMLAERRATSLLARAEAALRRNRELMVERKALFEQCRATRRAMRESVSAYAKGRRESGQSAAETLRALQEPVRSAGFVLQDAARAERLARDVARWCALEFPAA
jgi:hypothetical protein